MSNRTFQPKLPKGLAFDIADHVTAREWAEGHGVGIHVDLTHGLDDEEYEEVLTFYKPAPSPRLCWVMWREIDAIVVQPVVGRAMRFRNVEAALRAMRPVGSRRVGSGLWGRIQKAG